MNDIHTILERLIRMEEKLDSHLFRTQGAETRLDNHDERLRTLEQGHSKMYALAGVVALAVSGFGSAIVDVIAR